MVDVCRTQAKKNVFRGYAHSRCLYPLLNANLYRSRKLKALRYEFDAESVELNCLEIKHERSYLEKSISFLVDPSQNGSPSYHIDAKICSLCRHCFR
jgi:hypothetical protein